MAGEILLLGFLFVFAWMDLKKLELPLLLLGVCGAVGALVLLGTDTFSLKEMLGGLCVGGGLLLCALGTKESVGSGDGLLFCVTGIYLGLWQNLMLLFFAVVICAAIGVVLLTGGKCSRKQSLPFAPFVLAADVLLLMIR
ncbi:MAG: prepilin peptidase [Clostridiales bacterium]|nr:prepilin peptidase [Clostridiales bacterium]